MWIEPLCDKSCGVVANVKDLTLEQLFKINEYREIRGAFEEFHYAEQEREEKQKEANRRGA